MHDKTSERRTAQDPLAQHPYRRELNSLTAFYMKDPATIAAGQKLGIFFRLTYNPGQGAAFTFDSLETVHQAKAALIGASEDKLAEMARAFVPQNTTHCIGFARCGAVHAQVDPLAEGPVFTVARVANGAKDAVEFGVIDREANTVSYHIIGGIDFKGPDAFLFRFTNETKQPSVVVKHLYMFHNFFNFLYLVLFLLLKPNNYVDRATLDARPIGAKTDRGQPVMRRHVEIKLSAAVAARRDAEKRAAAAEQERLAQLRAFHLCRAHTRRLRSGKEILVRAHHRGDPSKGTRTHTYTV
jgi:hypothetical protein